MPLLFCRTIVWLAGARINAIWARDGSFRLHPSTARSLAHRCRSGAVHRIRLAGVFNFLLQTPSINPQMLMQINAVALQSINGAVHDDAACVKHDDIVRHFEYKSGILFD